MRHENVSLYEAIQRCNVHNMHIRSRWNGCDRTWRVSFNEDETSLTRAEVEKNATYWEDIEDAVLQAGNMRRARSKMND